MSCNIYKKIKLIFMSVLLTLTSLTVAGDHLLSVKPLPSQSVTHDNILGLDQDKVDSASEEKKEEKVSEKVADEYHEIDIRPEREHSLSLVDNDHLGEQKFVGERKKEKEDRDCAHTATSADSTLNKDDLQDKDSGCCYKLRLNHGSKFLLFSMMLLASAVNNSSLKTSLESIFINGFLAVKLAESFLGDHDLGRAVVLFGLAVGLAYLDDPIVSSLGFGLALARPVGASSLLSLLKSFQNYLMPNQNREITSNGTLMRMTMMPQ